MLKIKEYKSRISPKQLFWMLMPYHQGKYLTGKMIRWMIRGKNGRSAYCACCGNIANGVGQYEFRGQTFNIPFCKSHLVELWYRKHPLDNELHLPNVVSI
jgi:hypothetical protein